MERKVKIRLSERIVKMVVQNLNNVLDQYRIYGQIWNHQVIKELILQNLTKDETLKLIEDLQNTKISEWND